MDFTEIVRLMNETFAKTGKKPTGIKINPTWYERQLQQSFVLRKEGENTIETLTGLRTHIDSSIDTFEFTYKESE